MPFYAVAGLIIFFDQLIKYFIHRFMTLGQSWPLLDGFFALTYVRNTGAAFSLFIGFSPYLIAVGLLVVLAVIYFYYRLPPKAIFLQFALACVLGGSLGNLLDRIFRGYVVDYLDFTIWPVFNFADIMINLGVIIIAFTLFTVKSYATDSH